MLVRGFQKEAHTDAVLEDGKPRPSDSLSKWERMGGFGRGLLVTYAFALLVLITAFAGFYELGKNAK